MGVPGKGRLSPESFGFHSDLAGLSGGPWRSNIVARPSRARLNGQLSIQEIGLVQRIPLHGPEPGIADDAPEFLFGSAI
jgi:hypothetical protein